MKKVLISIKPRWCELIFNGKKTIEVRKNYPLQVKPPFEVLVYCTAIKDKKRYADELYVCAGAFVGNRKVIGSFICDRIDEIEPDLEYYSDGYDIDDDRLAETCLTREQLREYGKGVTLYGWHITDLKIYDKPKKLRNFGKKIDRFKRYSSELGMCSYECGECEYFDYPDNPIYETGECCADRLNNGICPLIRPPQSWQYVEKLQ